MLSVSSLSASAVIGVRVVCVLTTHFLRSGATVCIALGGRTVHSTRWSQILANNCDFFSYPICIWRLHKGSSRQKIFGVEKVEWRGYPTVEKVWRSVNSFRQKTRTWRTDGRTITDKHRIRYDTIRYDNVYLKCSKKLKGSLPHGINTKWKHETKNKIMSVIVRSSPVIVRQSSR